MAELPWQYYFPNEKTHAVASNWRAYQIRLRGELMTAEEEKHRLVQTLKLPHETSYLRKLPIDVRKNVLAATLVKTLDARIEILREQEAAVSELIRARRDDLERRVSLAAGDYLHMEPEYLDAVLRELSLLTPVRRQ